MPTFIAVEIIRAIGIAGSLYLFYVSLKLMFGG